MKTTRRLLISAAAMTPCAALVAPSVRAYAQSSTSYAIEFDLLRPEDDPEFGAAIRGVTGQGGSVVGTTPARHDEVRNGFRLLLNAPREKDVITTARYFEKITLRNSDNEPYNWEWAVRANPLIVGLFAATGTAPAAGDQTHWCAAFVSYCLFLANKPNKFTALSGGYRNFGSVSTSPEPGDIAVFAKPGPDGAAGFGHVAFFLRFENRSGRDGVVLLGGNQRGNLGRPGQ